MNRFYARTNDAGSGRFYARTNDTGELFPVIYSLSSTTVRQAGSLTINGSGFGATQSTSTVTLGGIACSATSWSDTAITVTIPSGMMFTGSKILVVTVSGHVVNVSGITYLPPTGYIFERITAIPVPASSMAAGITGLAVGDEVYLNATTTREGGSETATVVFNGAGDGTVSIAGVTVDGDYAITGIRVRDASDSTDTSNGPKTIIFDTTPPSGYSLNITQTTISDVTNNLIDLVISGAEVGTTATYTMCQ